MISVSAITVSQLNSYVKVLLESDDNIRDVFVSGEISNFKNHYASGHLYFSLKDEKSVVNVVMFSGDARKIKFNLSDGMKVIVRGRVSSYEAAGRYQLYACNIFPQGKGELYAEFELLKEKLFSEGIFDESLKKSIPKFPTKIGVVTSKTGAVIHDIKNVCARRYPLCEIILYPVDVQGERASHQIVQGLKYFNKSFDVDTIIVGRGGGSIEELWAFNKEEVARAVAESKIPIISAVGHETDVTICDFAADVRAATPSAAAEIVTPDKSILEISLNNLQERLEKILKFQNIERLQIYESLKHDIKKYSPINAINSKLKELQIFKQHLDDALKNLLKNKIYEYDLIYKRLESCSQDSILKKGYSLILKDSKLIRNIDDIENDSEYEIILNDGSVKCKIIDVHKICEVRK